MPQINFNKNTSTVNNLVKIGLATGINNFSTSSKLRLIADIASNDVNSFTELLNTYYRDFYIESATGKWLDLRGADLGIFRNQVSSIAVSATDQIIAITPRDSNKTFGDLLPATENLTLNAGDILEPNSGFRIVINESVTFNGASSDVYVSAVIEADRTSENGFRINSGDAIKINIASNPNNFKFQDFQLTFVQPVALDSGQESDADFRERVVFARDNSTTGHINAIISELNAIPVIKGLAIYNSDRGTGSMDIGFVTNSLIENGADSNLDNYVTLLKSRMNKIAAGGIDIKFFYPTELRIVTTYSYTSDDPLLDSVIADTIDASIKEIYTFSRANSINASQIESLVLEKIPSLNSFRIETMSLFDTVINLYISYGTRSITAPKGTFIRSIPENHSNAGS